MNILLTDLKALSPNANQRIIENIVVYQRYIDYAAITTPLRLCHFMAQLAHESAHFRTTVEYASGRAYEGRRDLGNVYKGDGERYRGRGLIQTTGRANYRATTKDIRLIIVGAPDFEAEPEKLADFPWALLSAISYWRQRELNHFADKDDIYSVTKRINGGTNGIKDRARYLAKAKGIWMFEPAAKDGNPPVLYRTLKGAHVEALQRSLNQLGYRLYIDGDFG